MFKINLSKIATISLVTVGLLAGCGSNGSSDTSSEASSKKVTTVKIAYDQASKPMTYTDENGNPTGYDVEIMKEVDKLLPDYKFEYVGTTSDDLLIGVEQGKYQAGVKNAFFTKERQQKFIFPKEFLGLSSIGLVLKSSNKDVKSLSDFASKGYSLAPIAANNAQYTVIKEYNDKNPNNKVKLKAGDEFTVDVVQWVNEGRVDGGVMIEGAFQQQVTSDKGAYHNLKNDVVYNEFGVIKTWPLFNKNQQKFADEYDKAIKKLKQEKIPNKLSKQFYGRDLFEVLDKAER
ncbi:transporter substrate-binding domain-containing protein [Rummeliibacillus pycnus]|uniref:transporter substrate-binding domain-containing protein n=1 Tax=Rummeliibacillus pycnus TaxID=101070 RepID=UPI000C9AAF01|nr:transporter substrate-binding domain-containing protein [Rummeliibacillus pycnus]